MPGEKGKEFCVAVVGGYSSGKSTFLNALIGYGLLSTGFLSGKIIPTYIHWGGKDIVCRAAKGRENNTHDTPITMVTMQSGEEYVLEGTGLMRFQEAIGKILPNDQEEMIHCLTDTEFWNVEDFEVDEGSVFCQIKKLDIFLPERKGFENLCFVEMPTFFCEKSFRDAGERILSEADAVILAENAQCVGTAIIREFWENCVVCRTNHVLVVLTNIDCLKKIDADRAIDYARELFCQADPQIYALSPYRALEYNSGRSFEKEDRVWAERFADAVDGIMSQIRGRHSGGAIYEAFSYLPAIIDSLGEEEKTQYRDRLASMQRRFQDPEFRLAVIGNFSCGKSTFLNALVGRELLATSNLPTTAIPTYIRWNRDMLLEQMGPDGQACQKDDPIVCLVMHDGTKYFLAGKGIGKFQKATGIQLPCDIGAMVDYLTTTNSLIGKIEKIDISFPEREGFEDFCLIDTPGINPGDEEDRDHIIQTQAVLCEEADAAIVLYTMKDAMTRDTRQFMEDNATHLMGNAIVVLTKMDLAPANQVEKIVRNTTRLVREQYHQENPVVYSISAGRAIEYESGRSNQEEDRVWAVGFIRDIRNIMRQLHVRRSEIVTQRVISLMTGMMDSISGIVSEETEKLEKENGILQKASISNLEEEFKAINADYENKIKSGSYGRKSRADSIVRADIQEKRDDICSKITNAYNMKELNRCLEEYYSDAMKGVDQVIIQEINKEIIPEINKLNKEYIRKVEECLDKYNRYLGNILAHSINVKSGIISKTTVAAPVSSASSFIENHAGLIAALGITMLIPGLNLIALAAGFLWDSARFNAKKEEARSGVQNKLHEYENQLTAACRKSIEETEQQNLKWARELLRKYESRYKDSFDSIEQEHIKHTEEVGKRIKNNRKNIDLMQYLKNRF